MKGLACASPFKLQLFKNANIDVSDKLALL